MRIQYTILGAFALFSLTFTSCGGGETEHKEPVKDSVVADTTAMEPKLYNGYEITEVTFEPASYLIKKGTVKFEEIGDFFGKNYKKMGEFCGKGGHEVIGAPLGFFWTWNDSTMMTEMAAGFAIKPKGTIAAKEFELLEMPAGSACKIAYYGAYEDSKMAHEAMDMYLKEKGLAQSVVMEEYITDPMAEPDTSKWLTNIYYFIK